uniref:MULE transposase domain-containing protein n=1 Tax=Ditylenchus dipsaci TaxID=166011 RepID=A0A915DRT5_9BILA
MGDFRAFLKGHPNGATDPVRLMLETPWDRMVVYDSGPGEDRTIAFSTRAMMEKIARAKVIASDGTFDTAPDGWAQLYVIHFQEGDELLPGMVALMTRKTSEAYRGLLFGLERWIRDNLALEWQPEKFLTDFEVAMDAIILEVFGAGTVHKGCYFHMTQAQQKKLRSLNLGPYYNKDVRFSEWVNKWKVLAVIPSLHIEELVEYLLDRQHPDHQWLAIFPEQAALETFTNYLINTWTGRREDVGELGSGPSRRCKFYVFTGELEQEVKGACQAEWIQLLRRPRFRSDGTRKNRPLSVDEPVRKKKRSYLQKKKMEAAIATFNPARLYHSLNYVAETSRVDHLRSG